MNYKILIWLFLIPFSLLGLVYAVNTNRVTIPETANSATWSKSYASQEIYIQDNSLSIINLDNNTDLEWDYFSWFYHDSAYWPFEMQFSAFSWNSSNSNWVRITWTIVNDCNNNTTHIWYKLDGFSYSPNFWAMDFNYNSSNYVYICVPRDENSDEISYLWWNAYSELIGTQHFWGIEFEELYVDNTDDSNDTRFVKIEWVTSSQNKNIESDKFQDDVRIIWEVQKSNLRKNISQNVYRTILRAPIDNSSKNVSSLWETQWTTTWGGTLLQNGKVLYFSESGTWATDSVRLSGTTDLAGIKTVVVEWGDVFIDNNILDNASDGDILGIIALQKWWVWWNIIIDRDVTDIHAVMYADRSLLSSVLWDIATGDTPNSNLRNQLYIKWSVFSENTIGGWIENSDSLFQCPFYVNNPCTQSLARKHDLSFLRRYILVDELDADDQSTWNLIPQLPGTGSLMTWVDNNRKQGYREYPLVIDYNPTIQTTPPPFFWN